MPKNKRQKYKKIPLKIKLQLYKKVLLEGESIKKVKRKLYRLLNSSKSIIQLPKHWLDFQGCKTSLWRTIRPKMNKRVQLYRSLCVVIVSSSRIKILMEVDKGYKIIPIISKSFLESLIPENLIEKCF